MADNGNANRDLFTQIGILMEDAAPVALMWKASDRMSTAERLKNVDTAICDMQQLVTELWELVES